VGKGLILLTTDDLIRVGACADQVAAWRDKHAPTATALPLEAALAAATTSEERGWISRAAGMSVEGYGYGDGYGGGDGYGDGYGGGYGDGGGDGSSP